MRSERRLSLQSTPEYLDSGIAAVGKSPWACREERRLDLACAAGHCAAARTESADHQVLDILRGARSFRAIIRRRTEREGYAQLFVFAERIQDLYGGGHLKVLVARRHAPGERERELS